MVFSNHVFSQVDYKGKIIDDKTGNPVPYVNIGIIDKGIGTVSDEDGIFHLEFNPILFDAEDIVLFSSLGYETLEIPVSKIELVYNEYPILKLKPSVLALKEVVVTNKVGEFVEETVGYKNTGEKMYGYWKDSIALGGELATLIAVKKGLRQLNSLGFDIWQNDSDSILVRINIYDIDGARGIPKTNLSTSQKSILHTIIKDDRFGYVDLVPYSIFVNDDFIVSIELLHVYGNQDLALVLAAVSFGNNSFRKYASQGKWEKISDTGMAFFLKTSYIVSKKEAKRIKKRQERRKEKSSMVSGFIIDRGEMISDVIVRNMKTKEWTSTNDKGRYVIHAKERDFLLFSKEGYQTIEVKVEKKPILNVNLKLKARK